MQCSNNDYESIDKDLCTGETNDDITAFVPTHSEVLGDDEEVSDNDDTAETPTITNFSAALENIKNLTLFASQSGDTDGLRYLHQIRTHYEKQLLTKRVYQTKISDFFKIIIYVHNTRI